jgi:hypothetical protein
MIEEQIELTKEDVTFTQEQINAMTEEEIKVINEKLDTYTNEQSRCPWRVLSELERNMQWFWKEWFEVPKDENRKHKWWRYKAAIELLLRKTGLKVKSIQMKGHFELGDISKDYYELKIDIGATGYFSKEIRTYKQYVKTKEWTPEEREAWNKEYAEKLEKKNKKQWERNCSKWDLKPEHYRKTFEDKSTKDKLTIIGCNPRDKVYNILCEIEYAEKNEKNKDGQYYFKPAYIQRIIKESKTKKKKVK